MEESWERPPHVPLTAEQLHELVEPAFPGRRIVEAVVLGAGLANTNFRLSLDGDATSYVLRLHTRDRESARRERDLMRYLAASNGPQIPVAPLIYSDPAPERGPFPYSIWGFVEGTLLQTLFGTASTPDLVAAAGACGRVLAALSAHHFARCGEFGPNLEVTRRYETPSRFVPQVVHRGLFEGRAGQRLGAALRDELWRVVERNAPRLRAIDGRYTLVHADYKRSNLLIQRSERGWQVGAVLDWEFAFAGPPLIDVGLFLRAGAALPEGFRQSFADAYLEAGGVLPQDWLPLSRLIDVVSQVTFLDDSRERPRVFAETTHVVRETLRMLA